MNENGSTGNNGKTPTTRSLNSLYFYLTEGCNLACRHCWLAPKFDPGASRFPVLSVEDFETAIMEAKPLGLHSVKLTGGEPLMHPHILDLLEIVRREELRLVIETNGIVCTPEVAAAIAQSPNRFVSVSLDGADAITHEWVRGVKGSFEQALEGIRNLVEHETKPQIIMSLMKGNVHQVEEIVRLAESIDANSVKYNIIQHMGRGSMIYDQANGIEIERLLEIGDFVNGELAASTSIGLHYSYPWAFRKLSDIDNGNTSSCGVKGILGVVPSGHYALCGVGEFVPDLVFGKVGEDPLEDVWSYHPVLNDMREGLPKKFTGICGRCLMKQQCLGSCIAHNYVSSGTLWGSYWFCIEAEEKGLFPASRLMNVAELNGDLLS